MSEAPGIEGALAFAAPPHLVHPSRDMVCWFTDPPGIVIQIVRAAQGTRAMTEWLGHTAEHALFARFPGAVNLTVVLDLSLMTGREPGARNGLVEPAKRMKARVARTILVPPRAASQVYLGSMYAATALLSAFGVHVEINRTMSKALIAYGLRVAPR
jgi:hypothetical protein